MKAFIPHHRLDARTSTAKGIKVTGNSLPQSRSRRDYLLSSLVWAAGPQTDSAPRSGLHRIHLLNKKADVVRHLPAAGREHRCFRWPDHLCAAAKYINLDYVAGKHQRRNGSRWMRCLAPLATLGMGVWKWASTTGQARCGGGLLGRRCLRWRHWPPSRCCAGWRQICGGSRRSMW